VRLPGRLRATTLGDLLGALHRAAATGTLELVEDRGRTHRVHLSRGLVVSVEHDGAGASLAEMLRRTSAVDDEIIRRSLLRALASKKLHGEVLVNEFHLSPTIVDDAVRRQLETRLAAIERIADARVVFRVTVRPPRGALMDAPLEPRSFLSGRRRARERVSETPPPVRRAPDTRATAWRVLGVAPGADASEIRRAFRSRVRESHPDLFPSATPEERRVLEARFAEVAAAYRALVA
jgi:DnaJ-domain-containing protein 1